ncbi:serine/threonine protein kinase [Marinomonas sp. 15G1-11]|uniref:Stress response kinase A n=1 Tax=Marinomonas phaeophyticola TaxID=3004091 RepID=A0ABT4JQP2_9GAMM|nr:serine/threonine protein kinase [Marinomonas sp. 15G1-11]MCZ2720682.1 serine/threonine protein kinase [Marinomonas sp. 15G1-11]
MSLHPFENLTPDFILDAVESTGVWSDARIYPLNSYENRVYQVGIEESQPLIAKFYRPDRWNKQQLLEEHSILRALVASGVSVVAPIEFNDKTLFEHKGFHFCLYNKVPGQSPDADNMDHLFRTGELIGEMHKVMKGLSLQHRKYLMPLEIIETSSQKVLTSHLMPTSLKVRYKTLVDDITRKSEKVIHNYWPENTQIIHGDCHRSNLLLSNDQLYLLDFDDCTTGPQIQDIWLHLSGDITQQKQQLSELIEGYESDQELDTRQLPLIDPLKAMRLIQYSAWLLDRWADPAFPKAFPWFATEDYWLNHLGQLKESLTQWGELTK